MIKTERKKIMEIKRISLPHILWLAVAIVAGIAVLSLVSVKAAEKAPEPNKAVMAEEKKETAMEEKQEKEMHKCTNMCVKNCQTNMENISSAMTAIKAAMDAIDKGDMNTAKSELEKADKLLASVNKTMAENMEKMPCVNNKCPISGKPIDMMDVPKDRTRMYKGMKVGFCCPMCPPQWDKLPDDQKDAKLKEAMPPKE